MTRAKRQTEHAPASFDVVIAGGGIAGLTLAVLLGRSGLRAALIDSRAPAPLKDAKPTGRTVALMRSSVNIVTAAGVWDLCEPHAGRMEIMRVIDDSAPDREPLEVDFPAEDIGMEAFGYNVPNAILHAALYEAAQGLEAVSLFVPDALADCAVHPGHAEAVLESGRRLRAPLIVGADGARSLTRTLAGIKAKTRDYGQIAMTCLINHSQSHGNISTEFHRPSGPFALVPLPGNRSSVVWVEHAEQAEKFLSLRKIDFERELQERTRGLLGGITLATPPESWPLRCLKARRLTAPRTALVAEAAHVLSPITAQGLNLSLRDVAALAETVIDAARTGLDTGSGVVLQQYERRRAADIGTRVFGVDALNRMVGNDRESLRAIRRTGLRILDAVAPLKIFAMKQGLAPPLGMGRLAKGGEL